MVTPQMSATIFDILVFCLIDIVKDNKYLNRNKHLMKEIFETKFEESIEKIFETQF